MDTKSLLKFVAAFGLLALVLIFLGVNYVPRISASSSDNGKIVGIAIQTRPNYINELYPRSIAPQLSFGGLDYFERHPSAVVLSLSYAGSDWIERHPSNYYTGSDWIERQP